MAVSKIDWLLSKWKRQLTPLYIYVYYVCMRVSMCVGLCVCTCVCICTCMCVCASVRACVYLRARVRLFACASVGVGSDHWVAPVRLFYTVPRLSIHWSNHWSIWDYGVPCDLPSGAGLMMGHRVARHACAWVSSRLQRLRGRGWVVLSTSPQHSAEEHARQREDGAHQRYIVTVKVLPCNCSWWLL